MAEGLRRYAGATGEAGLVPSGKDHGGGWQLGRRLSEVTFLDVYDALARPSLIAIGNRHRPSSCLIEKSVNKAEVDTMAAAEALFVNRFGELTLKTLLAKALPAARPDITSN